MKKSTKKEKKEERKLISKKAKKNSQPKKENLYEQIIEDIQGNNVDKETAIREKELDKKETEKFEKDLEKSTEESSSEKTKEKSKKESHKEIEKQDEKKDSKVFFGGITEKFEHFDYIKEGNILEKYPIEVEGANVEVAIVENKGKVTYNLNIPEIAPPTSLLLEEIRDELVTVTTISVNEIVDPEAFVKIKERFRKEAERLLRKNLKHISPEFLSFLIGRLMQDMLGLGEIDFLINDPNLEEIVVPSAKEPIMVYYKKYGWIKTNLRIKREEEILNYADIIARRVGRQITVLSPLLDAHLVSGDRVNAVLYPINTKGNTMTIRKFARNPYTMIDLIRTNTCNVDIASLLWLAIEYEMNVLISGGTASGKTSFLNACMPFIPPSHRIISIEDTRELMLPDFLYWTPLVTRTPNPEGKGGISMLDLLVNSLRMRPDRIILGEMRKEEEARVLFEAMHTGHSVYATVHADSAPETISRLVNPPLNVPPNLLKAVNLNIVMFRDRKRGIRRTLQIAEFEASSNAADSNILYRWIPEDDRIVQHSESSRLFEELSRNTGMAESEIKENLEQRKKILNYLLKNNIRSLEDFGKVMNFYYLDKDELLKHIENKTLKKRLGLE